MAQHLYRGTRPLPKQAPNVTPPPPTVALVLLGTRVRTSFTGPQNGVKPGKYPHVRRRQRLKKLQTFSGGSRYMTCTDVCLSIISRSARLRHAVCTRQGKKCATEGLEAPWHAPLVHCRIIASPQSILPPPHLEPKLPSQPLCLGHFPGETRINSGIPRRWRPRTPIDRALGW